MAPAATSPPATRSTPVTAAGTVASSPGRPTAAAASVGGVPTAVCSLRYPHGGTPTFST